MLKYYTGQTARKGSFAGLKKNVDLLRGHLLDDCLNLLCRLHPKKRIHVSLTLNVRRRFLNNNDISGRGVLGALHSLGGTPDTPLDPLQRVVRTQSLVSNLYIVTSSLRHRFGNDVCVQRLLNFNVIKLGLWLRLECSLDSLSIDSAHVIYVAEGHNVGAERQSSVMTLRKPIVTWII